MQTQRKVQVTWLGQTPLHTQMQTQHKVQITYLGKTPLHTQMQHNIQYRSPS